MDNPDQIRQDCELVEKVLRGDTNSFAQIIKATENLVAQILFKMIKNEDNRKDIAQDVYIKAYKNLSGFKFQSKLSTWIAQIAYNSCINFYHKKRTELYDDFLGSREEDDEIIRNEVADQESSDFQIEEEIQGKELKKILESEIEKLNPIYKTLITLFHNEELSYEEITSITQLPEGTVKNYLYRARKVLKTNLLKKYKEGEL